MKFGTECKRFEQQLKTVAYLIHPLTSFDREPLLAFASNIRLRPFERPDIILLSNHKTILLEHFRINALQNNNHDVLGKYQDVKELLNTKAHDGSYITKESFFDNLNHTFKTHAQKQSVYLNRFKNHSERKHTNLELGMIIENTHTPLYVEHTHMNKALLMPFQSSEFMTLLKQHEAFKHIFYIFKPTHNQLAIIYLYNTEISRKKALEQRKVIERFPQTDPVTINIFPYTVT